MKNIETEYYRYTVSQLERAFGTNVQSGLGKTEYENKIRRYSASDIDMHKKGVYGGVCEILASAPASCLFVILSFLYYYFTENGMYILPSLLCMLTAFSISVLYMKTKKDMEICVREHYPTHLVKRDGVISRIRCDRIVRGDIIYLSVGDMLTCDVRLVYTDSFRVLEKKINGGDGIKNADFICFEPYLEEKYQRNMAFSNSVVSGGHAIAIVCDTGKDTFVRRKRLTKRNAWENGIPFERRSHRLGRSLTALGMTFVFLTALLCIISRRTSPGTAFMMLLCLFCSTLLESAYPLLYIFFARYTVIGDGGKSGAYLRRLSSASRIKDITTLAVPKISGLCPSPSVCKIYIGTKEYNAADTEDVSLCRRLLCIAASVMDPTLRFSKDEVAIINTLELIHLNKQIVDGFYVPIKYFKEAFINASLVSDGKKIMMCCLSSASQLLKHCTHKNENGIILPLTDDDITHLNDVIHKYESCGFRVNGYGTKYVKSDNVGCDRLCFEGFIIMNEAMTEEDIKAVGELENHNVKVLIFCDDISDANYELGKRLGIAPSRQNILTSYELNHSNLGIIKLKMENYRMFLGLSAKEKQYVLDHLQRTRGEKIGIAVSEYSDISLITSSEVTSFDICSSDECDPLKLLSCSVVRSGTHTGAITHIVSLIEKMKQFDSCKQKVKRHFVFSGVLKSLAVICSLLSPFFNISPLCLVFSMLFDICALMHFFLFSKSNNIGKRKSLLQGVISFALMFVTSALLRASGADANALTSVVSASLILCTLTSFLICTYTECEGKKSRLLIAVIMLLCALIFAQKLEYLLYSTAPCLVFILTELLTTLHRQNK